MLIPYTSNRKREGGEIRARGQRKGGMSWAQFRPAVTDTDEERCKKMRACALEMARIAGDAEIVKIIDLDDMRSRYGRRWHNQAVKAEWGRTGKVGLDLLSQGPTWCEDDFKALNEEVRKVISEVRGRQRESRGIVAAEAASFSPFS